MTNDFKHADFYLAVTLSTLGFKIERLDRDTENPKRFFFCFEGKDGLEDAVQSYWDDKLLLSPQKLFIHEKLLRQRLHSTQP